MPKNDQFSIKGRAAKPITKRGTRTRGARGKKNRINRSTSSSPPSAALESTCPIATALRLQSPIPTTSKSPSSAPSSADEASATIRAPVHDTKCRRHKRSYTSSSTQTDDLSFLLALSTTTTASNSSAASTSSTTTTSNAASHSPSTTPSSPLSHDPSDDLSIIVDEPLTNEELSGWESGIRTAASRAERDEMQRMLREEMRLRGVQGMSEEVLEMAIKGYE